MVEDGVVEEECGVGEFLGMDSCDGEGTLDIVDCE